MALRPQDKVTERELSDVVVDKLNYLGNLKLTQNIEVSGDHGAFIDGEILTKGTRVHDVIQGILNSEYKRPYIFPMLKLTGTENNTAKEIVENELVKKTSAYKNNKIIYLDSQAWYVGGVGFKAVNTRISEIENAIK